MSALQGLQNGAGSMGDTISRILRVEHTFVAKQSVDLWSKRISEKLAHIDRVGGRSFSQGLKSDRNAARREAELPVFIG